MIKDSRANIFTAANILSMLRIILIPPFLVLLVQHRTTFAFFVFLFAVSTDLLDGIAARVWQQKTNLGTFLDPAADKLLMASSFIILAIPSVSIPNVIPIWLVIVVIFRDLYIVSGSITFIRLTKKSEVKPSIMGKLCTVVEMSLLSLVLLYNSLGKSPSFFAQLYWITLLLAFLSAAHYTYIGILGYRQYKDTK